jgi:hypothetical protein
MSEEISPGSMKRANSNVDGLLMILIWLASELAIIRQPAPRRIEEGYTSSIQAVCAHHGLA